MELYVLIVLFLQREIEKSADNIAFQTSNTQKKSFFDPETQTSIIIFIIFIILSYSLKTGNNRY